MMLSAAALHPVIAAWRNWRERAALRRELRQLEQSGELDATLADIGLSRGQLETLLASDPAAADLLPRMMRRFRFGPGKAGIIPFLRDMEWTCTACRAQRQCRKWLDRATPGYPSFCPNAAALLRLSRAQTT
jgi:uncharacterized protein YjiS (DUF1127 family)